jgi:hypothetical protein
MALDYKTLQSVATNEQQHADDYCPECGRPWIDTWGEHPRRVTSFPWRVALLGVFGLFLAITFGLRAGKIQSLLPDDQTHAGPAHVCVSQSDGPPDCPSLMSETTHELTRDLLATAGGMAIVLVGIGALIRPHLRAQSARGPSLVLSVWAVGETLGVVVSLQVLALYADLGIIRLSLGWPPAWWVALDLITEQVSDLFSYVTGL